MFNHYIVHLRLIPFINFISIKIKKVPGSGEGQDGGRGRSLLHQPLTIAPPMDVSMSGPSRCTTTLGEQSQPTGSAGLAPGRETEKGRNKEPESTRELLVPRKSRDSQGPLSLPWELLCYSGRAGPLGWHSCRDSQSYCTTGSGTMGTRETLHV